MIIYKIQENGQATDFTPAKKCPDGWKSIGLDDKIRKIEDIDVESYHEQRYLDSLDAIAWIGERKAEYQKEGCTEEALIVALWEKLIEGRPEAADALQVKRQAVKDLIKKP